MQVVDSVDVTKKAQVFTEGRIFRLLYITLHAPLIHGLSSTEGKQSVRSQNYKL